MKNLLTALFLFLAVSFSSYAQDGLGGIQFNGGIPVGGFQPEVGNILFPSISISGLYQLPKTPFFVGGELGYGRYGTAMTRSRDIINGTDQRFRIRRNNNAINLTGVVRVMPETPFWVRPFVEGQFGGIHTYTRSKVRENRLADPLSSGTEVYDWGWIYQLGGGLMIPLEKSKETFLELRVNYVQTSEMDFLTKRDASYNDQGQVTLSPRTATFQMIQPSIGVKFAF
ncbi:outer membrane beta-barrel protein [Belliella pelovolcani]|uniref:Outer membrane protein beta-barrel domain-containing protein n=1 Tax=Belliella pelovolcani TaxID=529505 RepID=A0A1N7JHS9_9BACT|nr:outer membrane beta-barrel protein [Belliella pelovolcani]SIS48922.1 Outer membrane protein beta-barrel domain-containing protein [Belliella pelovolcani]